MNTGSDYVRQYTNKIIDYIDAGLVDKDAFIRDILNWMSESDVTKFYERYGMEDCEDFMDYE